MKSPQIVVQIDASPTFPEQEYPWSILHLDEHPGWLSLSQISAPYFNPSPQIAEQVEI